MFRRVWIVIFLVLTGAALGMELVAGFDSDPRTVPWTELISTYIPQPVTVTVLTVLSAWLPVHFAHHYAGTDPGGSMGKYAKTIVAALTAGGVALGSALSDDKVSHAEWVVIGLAVLGALGVFFVPNAAKPARPAASDEEAAIRRSFR